MNQTTINPITTYRENYGTYQ